MTYQSLHERLNEIAQSKILAKAVVEKDGKFLIVAIFEKSQQFCFAVIFTARSKRSPRKCWKTTGRYHILMDAVFPDYRGKIKEASFDILLEHSYRDWSRKVRYYHNRKHINTFARRMAFPSEYGGIERIIVPGATYERANRITSGRIRQGNYG